MFDVRLSARSWWNIRRTTRTHQCSLCRSAATATFTSVCVWSGGKQNRGFPYHVSTSSFSCLCCCSVCARLHPKPQIEVRYEQMASLKPLEANKVKLSVINLGMRAHSDFKYPWEEERWINGRVAFVNSNEVLCSYVDQTLHELFPHVCFSYLFTGSRRAASKWPWFLKWLEWFVFPL